MPRTTLRDLRAQRFAELRKQSHLSIESPRPSPSKRGYDSRWRKRRLIQLRREPLCRLCSTHGRPTAATEVDHIVPLKAGGPDTFDNYQSLCHRCHSIKTAREDGGFGRRRTAHRAKEHADHDAGAS